MFFAYNLLTILTGNILRIIALFNPKMKLFVDGRKNVFGILKEKIAAGDKTLWFHAASLGEYEQGLPIMEKMRLNYPSHKIVLTFFSPSGYEIRKNSKAADVVIYLPLDTRANAKKFVNLVNPEMALFIKYEYWPNYLAELKKHNIPTYLISGLFRKKQVFFKWYGGFYRKALKTFTRFFVQDNNSKQLLLNIGVNNVIVSGDTRFDRVSEILERDNSLPFIKEFKNHKTTIVLGSSWPKDEDVLIGFINSANSAKFIIAPHNIKHDQIQQLKNSITKKTVLFSEKEGKNLSEYDVFIIDTIGILGKIYSYADIAYVGGGFGTSGLHNILEPAAFGVPIIIGPNHEKFPEAIAMIHMGGCIAVSNKEEIKETLSSLIYNEDYRLEKGHIAGTFVSMNRGAVNIIMNNLQE